MKLLVLFSILLFSTSAETTIMAAVRDTDGRSLRRGQEYYVLPLIRRGGGGGGLSVGVHGNVTCPLAVAQQRSEASSGLPVKFLPEDTDDEFVRMSTDLNVQFSAATICVQSTVWRLDGVDPTTGRRYVFTGGVKGSPGVGTVSNWFKIERYGERDYKLVHCPSVCEVCKVVCGDLGVFEEGGGRWLGVSEEPFPVKFKSVRPTR